MPLQFASTAVRVATLAVSLVAASAGLVASPFAQAASYEIDPAHSFVQFRIKHLGYSWLIGRFNEMSGSFNYDAEAPETNGISVEVKTASLDSNHAKRDEHLRGEDFLEVSKYPTATFAGTGFEPKGDGGVLSGELTLHGVTNTVAIEVTKLGEGKDPWGGYRAGFEGTLEITRADYGVDYNLGPASEKMMLELFVEGIRK